MAFQAWQIGLDIHNGQLCALGVQRRRGGWQLRHWWQHVLPHNTVANGVLQRSPALMTALQCWRKQLPRHISLRIGFPPQGVLQRQVALPAPALREPELKRYVTAMARRLFPIAPEMLALDYRMSPEDSHQLCITAARQDVLLQWLECLGEAGLVPQVLELTPTALGSLAQALRLKPGIILVHQLPDHWLWYFPDNASQPLGWCLHEHGLDFPALRQRYFSQASGILLSMHEPGVLPTGVHALSPFDALHIMHPPLPCHSGAFSLATGLALREEDG